MKTSEFIKQNPARTLVAADSTAAAIFLSAALVGQFAFGLHPCELCIAQRVPYGLMVALGVIAPLFVKTERMMQVLAWVCIVLFVIDGGIAVYHSGVELGWIHGPSACTGNDKPGDSIEQLRASIMQGQLVPCDQPMAYFLDLSMASWNALAALASAGLSYMALAKIKRRRA